MNFLKAITFIFISLISINTNAFLAGSVWETAAKDYNLDPYLLYSVALVESSFSQDRGKSVFPHPFAIRFSSKGEYFETYKSAYDRVNEIVSSGGTLDIGMMQVNTRYHSDKFDHPSDLLDPVFNIKTGAKILSDAINSSKDLTLGVGRYHSWRKNLAIPYGKKVLNTYKNIISVYSIQSSFLTATVN